VAGVVVRRAPYATFRSWVVRVAEVRMTVRVVATTALALLLSTTAYAGIGLLLASSGMAATAISQGYVATPDDHYGSTITGQHVYSSVAADAEDFGTIKDLVVDKSGKVRAVIVGVGGFLGIGQKNVAIDYGQVQWMTATDGSLHAVTNTTKEALQAAADFNFTDTLGPDGKAFAASGTAKPLTTPAATSQAVNTPAASVAGTNVSSFKALDSASLKTEDLKGIDVIGSDGRKLAEIDDFILSSAGKVDAVLVDFGGFLGVGKKEVAVAFDGLKFLSDNDGKRYLQVNVTKEQLEAQRAYNKDDYVANRDAERLVVGGVSASAATAAPAAAAPGGGLNLSTLKPIDAAALKSEDLKGIDVIGSDGTKIAEIDDFVLTSAGKVDAVLVDFGGFLGIGKKEVAIAFEGLKFLADNNSKRYLQVNVTKAQLDAQRAYNKDDYVANRAAERLAVGM
jgi:sporulation protein YlmC with PRC-barrel domain